MLLSTFTYTFSCRRKVLFLLGAYLTMELLGPLVTLCLTFSMNRELGFQHGCTLFYPHQQCSRVPVYLCPCQQLLISDFDNTHPSGNEVVSCGFDFTSLMGWCWAYFMCLLAIREVSVQLLCPFLKFSYLSFFIKFNNSFYHCLL